MSFLRVIGVAAAAISGGAALARNELDRRIEKKIEAKILEAEHNALVQLEEQIDTFIKDQLRGFIRNILFKAGFIALIIGGRYADFYSREAMAIIVALALAMFFLRDLWTLYPQARTLFQYARKHEWNLFQSLREMVATNVFDNAYEQVMNETQDKKVKYWIALSRYSAEDISNQIAEAISTVASQASVSIVRTRAGAALSKAGAMLVAYSATLAWALTHL